MRLLRMPVPKEGTTKDTKRTNRERYKNQLGRRTGNEAPNWLRVKGHPGWVKDAIYSSEDGLSFLLPLLRG
ncbi:unnamed protein product [Nezara viridula]|uniref:Uncharacterized protein n=1 Tax=Nezara viridula TaxID=85310 RepID=A0A9P0HSS4_NEZVI|nr:unnamed protein product [Nezara viridula]